MNVSAWALALTTLAAQDEVAIGPSFDAVDAEVEDADLVFSDVRRVKAAVDGRSVACEVTMARPFADGMYTCVHVYFDADRDEETGLDGGAEAYFRAAVGSRFRPNGWQPTLKGVPQPLENVRCSHSQLDAAQTSWLHRPADEVPVIDGATMRFRIPVGLFSRLLARYDSKVRVMVSVETTCSDQPLTLDHTCAGDGVPVQVDGRPREWTSRPVRDEVDELHPSVRFLDLQRFRVDHDPERLFICVEAAQAGLIDAPDPRADILVLDVIEVLIEPLGAQYDRPRYLRFGPGRTQDFPNVQRAIRGRALEVGVPRNALQGRYRVQTRARAVRFDPIEEQFLDLAGALR